MPKKKQLYRARVLLSSLSTGEAINPGETVEMSPDDAQILLDNLVIEEVSDDTNNRVAKLGELQDRTE